jgi:hypothetical protein
MSVPEARRYDPSIKQSMNLKNINGCPSSMS